MRCGGDTRYKKNTDLFKLFGSAPPTYRCQRLFVLHNGFEPGLADAGGFR